MVSYEKYEIYIRMIIRTRECYLKLEKTDVCMYL